MTDLSIRIHMFMTDALSTLRDAMHREEGQDMIEYALFGGLLAVAIITLAGLIVAGTIPNPVQALTDGLGGCIDFKASTPCTPY